ncbi:MAG: adenylate/guanylate cyclase domain-containing protein [Undibacterium sp.]|nr:adenylate/guanylate cyclase domain-containing protein [Opitutaceae bacterium]
MAKLQIHLIWRVLWLLPIPLLWCFLSYSGQLVFLENKLTDLRYRFRGEIYSPVKIFYVDVDTRALQLLGERPWNREYFGHAAEALLDVGHAKGVGFDFVFSALSYSEVVDVKKVTAGNRAFGRVIFKHPRVVLAAQYTFGAGTAQVEGEARRVPLLRLGFGDRTKNDLPELPQDPLIGSYIDKATGKQAVYGRIGLIDVDEGYGSDAVPRWVPLFAHTLAPTFYSLSLQLALLDAGLDQDAVKVFNDRIDLVDAVGRVHGSIPLTEGQLIEVNWFSRWINEDLNPRVSLADVLLYQRDLTSEKPAERAAAARWFEQFSDAIILVGPTDLLLQDLAPTPWDNQPVPRIGLHGNLVKTIRSGLYLNHTPKWVDMVAILALTLITSGLWVSGGVKGLRSKLTAVLVLVAYVWFALTFFRDYHWLVPLAGPLGGAFTTSFAALIWQVIDEEKQKGRIKGMFGAYLAPALVAKMVDSGEDPQLGGVEENITAYFSDIQSFSSFSEKLTPQGLVGLMNEYLTACTDIVQAEGGTLDKYIGDAVVAIYGAPLALPDNGYRACVAALRVHARIAELREKWRHETEKNWPEIVLNLQTRIGLNTGLAVVGNMGSTSRFSYTMMGDNVNLAARMESGAKKWGVYSMCSEATKLECEKHGGDRVVFRPLGRIVVRGRTTAVPIYEIAALRETATPEALECYGIFTDGLNRYYERDWDGALARFEQSKELEPNQPGKTPGVTSNPSLVYLGITEHAKHEPPPENWGGVYVMKEK